MMQDAYEALETLDDDEMGDIVQELVITWQFTSEAISVYLSSMV